MNQKDQEAAKSLIDDYFQELRNGGEPEFPLTAWKIVRGENEEANIIAASVRE